MHFHKHVRAGTYLMDVNYSSVINEESELINHLNQRAVDLNLVYMHVHT